MSPTTLRRRSALAFSGAFVFLAGCQDPSGVGLEIIGEEGTDPDVNVVAADSVMSADEDDFTGGFGSGLSPVQSRVLVGAASDPLLGDVSAFAYVDFRPPDVIPEGFLDRTIVSASLRLVRDYVYGDSTVSVPIQLHQMDMSWLPIGAPSDSTFEAGELLVEATALAQDTVVTLSLPSSWVTQYDEILRTDSVASAIDGFQIRLPDGAVPGAVMGFDTARSTLQVRTAEDTVDYPLFEVFSHIERDEAPPPPPDRLILRAGASESVVLNFPFSDFEDLPLANATLRLSVDASLLDQSGFARALPQTISLFGRTEAGDRLAIGNAALDEDTNSYSFTSATLTAVIQEALLGSAIVEQFEISVAPSPVSLDALPLILGPEPLEGQPDTRPRFALTVIRPPS